jgi:hypothetical protein
MIQEELRNFIEQNCSGKEPSDIIMEAIGKKIELYGADADEVLAYVEECVKGPTLEQKYAETKRKKEAEEAREEARSIDRFKKELAELNINLEKNASSSVFDVFKVNDTKRNKQIATKMDFISKFPVPNSKARLLEFMQVIQPSAKINGPQDGLTGFQGMSSSARQEDLSYAYWLLFANCINKAKTSFMHDRDFAPFFDYYDKEISRSKGIVAFLTKHKFKTLYLTCLLGFIAIIFFTSKCAIESDEKREKALQEEVQTIKPEVDAQYEKLCTAIEALGMPNEKDFEEKAFALINITWSKISTLGTEYSPNPYEAAKKESFLKKKETYANRLQQIYRAVYGYSEDNDSLNAEYLKNTPKEIIDISFDE